MADATGASLHELRGGELPPRGQSEMGYFAAWALTTAQRK